MNNLCAHIFPHIHYCQYVVEGVAMCARPSSVVVSEEKIWRYREYPRQWVGLFVFSEGHVRTGS